VRVCVSLKSLSHCMELDSSETWVERHGAAIAYYLVGIEQNKELPSIRLKRAVVRLIPGSDSSTRLKTMCALWQ